MVSPTGLVRITTRFWGSWRRRPRSHVGRPSRETQLMPAIVASFRVTGDASAPPTASRPRGPDPWRAHHLHSGLVTPQTRPDPDRERLSRAREDRPGQTG